MGTLSSPRRLLLRPLFLRRLPLHHLLRPVLPNEDISSYPAIRGFWVEVFWTYSAHCPMVRPTMPLSSFQSCTRPCLRTRRKVAPEVSEKIGAFGRNLNGLASRFTSHRTA